MDAITGGDHTVCEDSKPQHTHDLTHKGFRPKKVSLRGPRRFMAAQGHCGDPYWDVHKGCFEKCPC